jgi:hypothetical protein
MSLNIQTPVKARTKKNIIKLDSVTGFGISGIQPSGSASRLTP